MLAYPFACSSCGAEFDLARAAHDANRPVACPVDGAPSRRVYGVSPADPARRARAVPYGASWHDHGPGTEPHLHAADEPHPPAVPAHGLPGAPEEEHP